MRALNHTGMLPASLPLSADDIVEFHIARLLLLLSICGVGGRIDGLTKMAKLDFFARYPEFFAAARSATAPLASTDSGKTKNDSVVESAMVRHHYGPWDKRYYQVLAHMEAKQLITVSKEGNGYKLKLTDLGKDRAKALAAKPSFAALVERMREIKKAFGSKSGSSLKDLIYRQFDEEVGQRQMGKVIHS